MTTIDDEAPRETLERAIRGEFQGQTRPATVKELADVYLTLGATQDLLSAIVTVMLRSNPNLVGLEGNARDKRFGLPAYSFHRQERRDALRRGR